MKKRLLPVLLAMILLLSACGLPGRSNTAETPAPQEPGSAQIQMYHTTDGDASESENAESAPVVEVTNRRQALRMLL